MKNFVCLIAAAGILALSGCISETYRGKTFKPTKELAVFYADSDMPKGKYQQFGELEIVADTVCSSEAIVEKIRESAMAKGADAVVIDGFDARFYSEHEHSKSCDPEHGCHHEKYPYKYKQLVKVILLKIKTAE